MAVNDVVVGFVVTVHVTGASIARVTSGGAHPMYGFEGRAKANSFSDPSIQKWLRVPIPFMMMEDPVDGYMPPNPAALSISNDSAGAINDSVRYWFCGSCRMLE